MPTPTTVDQLTPDTIAGYVRGHPDLRGRVDADTLTAREIGDGNLNLVFLCHDAAGRGLCLKQALPLHTGSVMTVPPGGDPAAAPARVIDPEFCCYGPVGYDLGLALANYLHAAARAHALGADPADRAWLRGLPGETWDAFTTQLHALWPQRVQPAWPDAMLSDWLDEVWADAVGYAACEAIRRVVGLAKVTDLTTLPPAAQLVAARLVLRTARGWLTSADRPAAADLIPTS